MRLTYFTDGFLESVRRLAEAEHTSLYGSTERWVEHLPSATAGMKESNIEIAELMELTCGSENRTESDAPNAMILYESLKLLSPVQASDERLWACLTHTRYWDYMRKRWPRGSDDSFESIRTRWFFGGNAMERLARNGLARLWWGAYATVLPNERDPFRLTKVLFQNTEIQFGYMERLFGKNRCVLHTALDFTERNASRIRLRRSLSAWARETGKLINRAGGVLQLDAMEPADVETILEDYLRSLFHQNDITG